MSVPAAVQYRVVVKKDPETGSVVAEIPALQIADSGADVPEALDRLQTMLTFHLDCLLGACRRKNLLTQRIPSPEVSQFPV